MKRAIFTLFLAVAVCSCSGNQKSQLEKYLNEEYPNSGCKVLSVEKPDMYYTPFDVLLSLNIRAAAARSLKDFDDEFYNDINRVTDALEDPAKYAKEHPEKCNRRGYEALVKTKDGTVDIFVFYDIDDRTIGHTSVYLNNKLQEILNRVEIISYGY